MEGRNKGKSSVVTIDLGFENVIGFLMHHSGLRYLQNMLGHNSPKTTELYTKTIQINNKDSL